jgi:hypothetical protein
VIAQSGPISSLFSWSRKAHPKTEIAVYKTSFRLHICALLFLLCTSAAQARIDYCVGNEAQLQAAISAADNDGDASPMACLASTSRSTGT